MTPEYFLFMLREIKIYNYKNTVFLKHKAIAVLPLIRKYYYRKYKWVLLLQVNKITKSEKEIRLTNLRSKI